MELQFRASARLHKLKQFIFNFCKKILGVKQSTQNGFIYGELGRIDYQSRRYMYLAIIKYWFKVVCSEENKHIKQVYNMMLDDIAIQPLKQNWASCVKDLFIKSIRIYGRLAIKKKN